MEFKKNSTFQISFFAALCLFLSAVEYAIPKPLPFLRLGLANLPILLAVKLACGENTKIKKTEYLILILLKILGQAFISGTLFSYVFLFSAAGSFASGIAMLAVYDLICFIKSKRSSKLELVTNIGLSLAGSLANNISQLVCSKYIMFGENTKYIAPILFISGTVTGVILGVFANIFEEKSEWFKGIKQSVTIKSVFIDCKERLKNKDFASCSENEQSLICEHKSVPINDNKKQENKVFFDCSNNENVPIKSKQHQYLIDNIWFVTSLVTMICFFFIKNIYALWGLVLLFFVLSSIKKRKVSKVLPSIFITITVTFFSMLSPYGKVLFKIGSWRITQDALISGLHRSAILVGMVFLSQCAVSRNLQLPGKAGDFLASMFKTFDMLTAKKISFKPGKIIFSIDKRLCEISEELACEKILENKN
ncbi:MAG: Gx transporter family protein [Treponema sp.]